MRRQVLIILLAALLPLASIAQEKWYHNPLSPLIGGPGFLAAGAAVGASLLLAKSAKKDTSFTVIIHSMQDAGHYQSYEGKRTSVYMGNFSVIYRTRKWMSLGAQFNAIHFRDYFNNTWGFGLRPFARWYPVQRKGFKLFFEYAAGALYTIRPFPIGGTRFNFTPNYSIGNEWAFDDNFSLQYGYRHQHVSNAYLFGKDRNPAHDSNGFFIGFKYRYRKKKLESLPEKIIEEPEKEE